MSGKEVYAEPKKDIKLWAPAYDEIARKHGVFGSMRKMFRDAGEEAGIRLPRLDVQICYASKFWRRFGTYVAMASGPLYGYKDADEDSLWAANGVFAFGPKPNTALMNLYYGMYDPAKLLKYVNNPNQHKLIDPEIILHISEGPRPQELILGFNGQIPQLKKTNRCHPKNALC